MERSAIFAYNLLHVATIAGRQADQLLQERLGIGLAQYKLLRIVEQRDACVIRQRQLADCLGQTEASISRQVKLLAEKGMIVTGVNPKSRRDHIAELTEKGAKLLLASNDILHDYFVRLLDQIDKKEQATFIQNLTKIHQGVCAQNRPFSCDMTLEKDIKQKEGN